MENLKNFFALFIDWNIAGEPGSVIFVADKARYRILYIIYFYQ